MRVVEGEATVEDADAFVERLRGVGEEHDCAVQAFDARVIAGRDHLAAAVERANRAFARDENVARERAVEILLYAAGRRQINRALALGVPEGTAPVAVVVDAAPDADERAADRREAGAADAVRELLVPGSALDERDEAAIREFFGVTAAERAASTASLEALVRERVALLAVDK